VPDVTPVPATGCVTRKVIFTVDTPAAVSDSELAGRFADMWADAPITPGWWVSVPVVTEGGSDE
jgi:hypothetical protein